MLPTSGATMCSCWASPTMTSRSINTTPRRGPDPEAEKSPADGSAGLMNRLDPASNRPITQDSSAVHASMTWPVVRHHHVLGRAIIPEQHVPGPPAMAIHELRPGLMPEQEVKQRTALFDL